MAVVHIYCLGLAVLLSGVFAQYEDDSNEVTDNGGRFSDPSCRQCLNTRDLTACAVCLAKYDPSTYEEREYKPDDNVAQNSLVQYIACKCCSTGDSACCATCRLDGNTNDAIASEKRGINPNPRVPYFVSGGNIPRYSVFGKRSVPSWVTPYNIYGKRNVPSWVTPYTVYGKRNVPSWVTPYFIYGGKRGLGYNPIPPFVDSKRAVDKRGIGFNYYKSKARCTCCDWDSYNFKCCLTCSTR